MPAILLLIAIMSTIMQKVSIAGLHDSPGIHLISSFTPPFAENFNATPPLSYSNPWLPWLLYLMPLWSSTIIFSGIHWHIINKSATTNQWCLTENWVCQKKKNHHFIVEEQSGWHTANALQSWDASSLLVPTPLFCFTYPLPDHKKALRIPEITTDFLWFSVCVVDSWILFKDIFENNLFQFGILGRCFQKANFLLLLPVPWDGIAMLLNDSPFPQGLYINNFALLCLIQNKNYFLTSVQQLFFLSFPPCSMQLSVLKFKHVI